MMVQYFLGRRITVRLVEATSQPRITTTDTDRLRLVALYSSR